MSLMAFQKVSQMQVGSGEERKRERILTQSAKKKYQILN